MTDEEAFEIQKQIGQLEFPFIFLKSLQFALFRVRKNSSHRIFIPITILSNRKQAKNLPQTYGIPTISNLLTKTSQFSNSETSLKRYADTGALVTEMIGNSPTSQRTSGKILDTDMLFKLALFALQPIKFIARFEWRELSELKRCAFGTFWKSVGDALGIPFDELPSGRRESSGLRRSMPEARSMRLSSWSLILRIGRGRIKRRLFCFICCRRRRIRLACSLFRL